MKPAAFALDFKQRPAVAMRRVGVGVLVVALAAAVFLGEGVWRESQRHAAATARLERAAQRSKGPQPGVGKRAPDAETLLAARRGAAVAEQLDVPWVDLFGALEAADAHPLGLLSMTPNARDGSLRVSGEARSTADLLAYVERLAAQHALMQVHLIGYHSALRDGVPVVAFSLAASWRPRP